MALYDSQNFELKKFALKENFITQDGWGYIKASKAKQMGLTQHPKVEDPYVSSLSYQATQCYESKGNREAVKEVLNLAQDKLKEIKQSLASAGHRKDKLNNLYPLFWWHTNMYGNCYSGCG